ncbi:MAG TPA: PASTA domain-containing protein [Longimicrobium sp.]|nr:PASTA domain-containing protein [Longimicrobium sp.]
MRPPAKQPGRRRFPAPAPGWHRELPARVRRYFDERELLKWVLVTGLSCFVVGYLLMTVLFFPGWGRAGIVTVPDLTNRSAQQADRALDRAGLKMLRGDTMSNPRVPRGRVLMQVPLPGEEVARGSQVRIVLSTGPELRPVPSIRGLGRADAIGLLQRYGFRAAIRRVSDRREEGTLLGLTPAAGRNAAVGSVVTMLISAGPPFVRVPALAGMQAPDARTRLQAGGLELGRVGYDPASPEPAGTVVAQSPVPGDSLRMGASVRVTLAGADPSPPPPPTVDSVAADPAVAEEVPAEEPAEPEPEEPAPPVPPR